MANAAIEQYMSMKLRDESGTDPRVVAAYALQERMEAAKREYESCKEELHDMLASIGPYSDDTYKISNLKRAPRKIDMTLLRENMPELLEHAEPSDKYLIQTLIKVYGRDTLLSVVKEYNPAEYEAALTLSVSEFDKLTGDSSKEFKFAGKAYHERWIEDNKEELCITRTRPALMQRVPSMHPVRLEEAEE